MLLQKYAAMAVLLTSVAGCVYKMEKPQGNMTLAQNADLVQIGQTREQVRYLLGTPAIYDTLTPNRWDYVYDYQAGTEGRKKGNADVSAKSTHISVYFQDDKVVRIER